MPSDETSMSPTIMPSSTPSHADDNEASTSTSTSTSTSASTTNESNMSSDIMTSMDKTSSSKPQDTGVAGAVAITEAQSTSVIAISTQDTDPGSATNSIATITTNINKGTPIGGVIESEDDLNEDGDSNSGTDNPLVVIAISLVVLLCCCVVGVGGMVWVLKRKKELYIYFL